MKSGQQKRIPAFTSPNHSYHLIGAYLWAKDQVFTQAVERKNSQTFIQFLEYLLVECCPTQKIVLVMDNASYHKSASALAALSLFEHRVMLVWLPPYCSDLNPIERFWRHLKDLACANKLQDNIEAVVTSAENILNAQNLDDSNLRFLLSKNL